MIWSNKPRTPMITEYMLLDHSGWMPPGRCWEKVESGETLMSGALPINPSGGLIGLGHPVGATGVRMVLDAYRQTTGSAGEYQLTEPKNIMTFNIGGSTTTAAAFIVGVSS